jgi:hypothetical protein
MAMAVTPVMAPPPNAQPPALPTLLAPPVLPPVIAQPLPPTVSPMALQPTLIPALLPPQPPILQPLAIPTPPPPMMQRPPMPQANHAGWGPPQLSVGASPAMQAMYDRAPPYRQPGAPARRFPRRKTPLKPWMLVIGALIMALLAFAVTRACIHTATSRSPSESK